MTLLRNISLIALLILINHSLFSQAACGTEDATYKDYSSFIAKQNFKNSDAEHVVPVQIQIVTKDHGEYSEAKVRDILEAINTAEKFFHTANIRFSICGINFVQNTRLLDFNTDDVYQLVSYNNDQALNFYIVQSVEVPGFGSACGVAALPWRDIHYTAIACLTPSIVAHEIGHMLGLLHTHQGYEEKSERADGSNCHDAGDYLCDTPADPRLSWGNVSPLCNYTGSSEDSNGDRYNPNAKFIMSYAPGSCKDVFSEEQGQVMRYALNEFYPSVHCGQKSTPTLADLENTDQHTFPNPAGEVLNVVFNANIDFSMKLYDLNGNLIETTRNENQMYLQHLQEGMYLLEVTEPGTGFRKFERIVVSRDY